MWIRISNDLRGKLGINFFYISLSQIVNYVFPLLTFPYLVRVLGLDGFGLYSFAAAFVMYFTLIVEYGFNIIGVKNIVENGNSPEIRSAVYSSIFFSRLLLFLIGLVVFSTIVFSVPKFRQDYLLYLSSYSIIISSIVIPFWFYQAVEQMKYISIINTISKIISTALVFVLIKSKSDVALVPMLYTVASLVVGIISYKIIAKNFNVELNLSYCTSANILSYLKNGWHYFVSNLSISLYTSTLPFFLGVFGTTQQVAYFTIPNKIISIVRMAFEPVTQTFFPHFSNLSVTKEWNKINSLRQKLLIGGLLSLSMVCLIIFAFAPELLSKLFKVNSPESIFNLRIQIFIPVILWFHVIFGFFFIIVHNLKKLYSNIILWSSIISIPVTLLLIYYFKDIGASWALLLVEFFIGLAYIYYYFKNKNIVYAK